MPDGGPLAMPFDGGSKPPPDSAVPDADTPDRNAAGQLAREAAFWDMVAICSEPVIGAATVTEAAERADAVVVGRIVDVSVGNVIQGDAIEDIYAEVNLHIEVEELLRYTIKDPFQLSLILANPRHDALESTVAEMRARLPQGPVVLLLLARDDFEDVYLPFGGDLGLWTGTARNKLDNPLAGNFCAGQFGEYVQTTFLEGIQSIDALIEYLRQ